ncbi:zinc-dependent alcohol dehydrogenase family protein [Myxococcus sp. CA039A]|uniref:zinc-dependent alcohol dehydrogenase family protein n=1 Tax=Myxococcus sp. CA039A TaxID=2741737 RepID=UPI00157A4E03|nr:zinc-dependent alcohol dehydrogenase family protein [Myxococcus sp. CA039A]NTX49999.1 zinc-dependent alcohol dehydrogenase family protein [Myxococcus sp. CA039A]
MKAIVFDQMGPPLEVLQLREVPVPEPREGEVRLKLLSASINPGDFLFIQGLYPEPKKPALPGQVAGNHGAGIITRVGKGVVSWEPGTLVAFSHFDSWAEHVALPAERLIRLPPDYPLEKASQFFNIITAWDLLERANVRSGQWLALTAGNSTVATLVAQFARLRGVKVLSIVRERQATLDLESLGISAVLALSEGRVDVGARVRALTGGQGVHGVIDCVGGALLEALIQESAPGGQVIVYGGFSPERFSLHNFDLLMKDLHLRAYVYRYFFDAPRREDEALLQHLVTLSAPASFQVPVGPSHALEDFKLAVEESLGRPEAGKRFFRMPRESTVSGR